MPLQDVRNYQGPGTQPVKPKGHPTPASLARGVGEGAIAAVGSVAGRVEGLASGAKDIATNAAVSLLPSFLTRAAGTRSLSYRPLFVQSGKTSTVCA